MHRTDRASAGRRPEPRPARSARPVRASELDTGCPAGAGRPGCERGARPGDCGARRSPGGRAMRRRVAGSSGQASLMMLAVAAIVLAGGLLLFAFGNALGAKG